MAEADTVDESESILDEISIDDFEESNEEEYNSEVETDSDAPEFASEEWTDYVMGLLTDREKVGEAPRTEGLLRVARRIFGNLNFSKPEVHNVNPQYAAVTVGVLVGDLQYIGSAEVSIENTDAPYNKFPLASAETRAIGRAIKRLLCINVITAEETSKVADFTVPKSDEDRTEGEITASQIKLIEKQCKSVGFDVKASVISIVGDHKKMDDLSHAEALTILKQLDAWKREAPTDVKLEPFNQNWRDNF